MLTRWHGKCLSWLLILGWLDFDTTDLTVAEIKSSMVMPSIKLFRFSLISYGFLRNGTVIERPYKYGVSASNSGEQKRYDLYGGVKCKV